MEGLNLEKIMEQAADNPGEQGDQQQPPAGTPPGDPGQQPKLRPMFDQGEQFRKEKELNS